MATCGNDVGVSMGVATNNHHGPMAHISRGCSVAVSMQVCFMLRCHSHAFGAAEISFRCQFACGSL